MTMNHGVVHFEMPADDPEKLADFYRQLFGWQIDKMDLGGMEYWTLVTGPTDENGMPSQPGMINGGLSKREMQGQTPVNYVNVESVDQYVEKGKSLGASVATGKMAVPGMGWYAMLIDPQGNPIGVWQTDPGAA